MRHVRATVIAMEKQRVLYNLSVFVALVSQHAMRMRHIAICGLPRSTMFFFLFFFLHFLITGTIFERGYRTQNVCFDFLYNFYLKHFSF